MLPLRYVSIIMMLHAALSGIVIADRNNVYPRLQQPKLALTDFDLFSHTAECSPNLPLLKVSTSVINVNIWITTHFSPASEMTYIVSGAALNSTRSRYSFTDPGGMES